MNLYYHTSSKNFSAIFETESVSPKLFYSKRSFGTKRFSTCPFDLSEEYLTLYSRPNYFEFSDSNNFPMWLEFDIGSLENYLIDFKVFAPECDERTIFLFPKSIYFDHQTFRCLFRDTKELKYTKIDSESYRNVKTVSKYRVDVLDTEFLKYFVLPTNYQIMTNSLSTIEINKDRYYNNIKGAIYGFSIGVLKELTPSIKNLISLISELQKNFTNAKSQIIMHKIDDYDFGNKNNYSKKSSFKSKFDYTPPPKYNINSSKNEILDIISELEDNVSFPVHASELEPDKILEHSRLILYELEKEGSDYLLIDEFKTLIKNLEVRNRPFVILRKTVEDFFRLANSKNGLNSEETELQEKRFKVYLKKVENIVHDKTLKANSSLKGLELKELEFVSTYKLTLNKSLVILKNDREYVLFEIIVKMILKYPRSKKQGEISREEKGEMIARIGKEHMFQTQIGNKKNPTEYYLDLLHLYNHYTKYTELKIDSLRSNVLQNFASFLLKIDQFDELIEFCQNRNIDNRKIAFCFWCGYNGFSEISEKNSKLLFSSENWTLINSFDNFLSYIISVIEREMLNEEMELIEEGTYELTEVDDNFSVTESRESENVISEQSVTYNVANKMNVDAISLAEAHLSDIAKKIKESKNFTSLDQTKQEDVLEGLSNANKVVLNYVTKGTEIFSNLKQIIAIVKKQIIEKNKKRRKKEYKITELELNELVSLFLN